MAGVEGLDRSCTMTVALGATLLLSMLVGCSETTGSNGGSAGASAASAGTEKADAIAVQVAPVVRQAVSSLYSTSATLRADRRATVMARTRGVIRGLLVEEGDRVREGDPLAVLEDDEQRIELARASATDETKRREYERAERLHEQGLISEEAYETARREHAEAEQAAALARLALSRTVVRAPFSGRILRRHLDVGATVSDGTAVYDLADLEPLYADVNVPERHLARLQVGQPVRLVADATNRQVVARIERLAPAVDAETGTVKVTLAVDGSAELRPGTFVKAHVVTDTHLDALVVRRSALVAEGRRWHLYRLDAPAGTVQRLEVRPGFEEEDRVEIAEVIGGTLEAGQSVVVVGAAALTDGARVQVILEDGPAADVASGA